MSQHSQISITIPPAVVTAVRANLQAAIDALAPYVHALTASERQEIPKMSNKTVSFVSKVISYCDTNPAFTPSYLDVPEMTVDYTAVTTLKPLLDLAEQLFSNLEDTSMLCGSEAYMASLLYYNNVRGASKQGIADAETIYDDLQERFPGNVRKKKAEKVE